MISIFNLIKEIHHKYIKYSNNVLICIENDTKL